MTSNVRILVLVIATLASCGRSRAPAAAQAGPSCKAIAVAAERWIQIAPASERERLLRLAVELVDLCQAPGLSAATRKCVAGADSATAARACPALPLTPDATTYLPPDERAVRDVLRYQSPP